MRKGFVRGQSQALQQLSLRLRLRRMMLDAKCLLDGHNWYSTYYCPVDPRCRCCGRCGKSQHADDATAREALSELNLTEAR